MEIKGKVHCFFEQSGTFKQEFIKLGIPAEDYDIQNNFGETDHVNDLFLEIEKAYDGQTSLFDKICKDDLIIAFFPCIEFSCVAQMWYSLSQRDYTKWPYKKRIDYMVNKNRDRARLYELMMKFTGICLERDIRMVMENPWSENTYLKQNVIMKPPTFVDTDRTRRGDWLKKPTAYWFWNCEPTTGYSLQQTPKNKVRSVMNLKKAPHKGLCSKERSTISPNYACNFICDFIIGKKQAHTQATLFDEKGHTGHQIINP